MKSPRKFLPWIKAGLSVLILFHLSVIVLVPNPENYLGQKANSILDPYTSFFEIASRWSFFAPEPGPPPVYVEYELVDKNGDSIGKGSFPEKKSPFFLRERQNRRISSVEFMVLDPVRTEKVMLGFICDKHPEADSVRIWRVSYSIPTMEEVASGKRKIGDDEGAQRVEVSHSFCEGRNKKS